MNYRRFRVRQLRAAGLVHLFTECCVLTTDSLCWRGGCNDQLVDGVIYRPRSADHGCRRWTDINGQRQSDVLRLRSTDQGSLVAERRWSVVAWELLALLVLSVRPRRRRLDSVRSRRPATLSPRLPQVSWVSPPVLTKGAITSKIKHAINLKQVLSLAAS